MSFLPSGPTNTRVLLFLLLPFSQLFSLTKAGIPCTVDTECETRVFQGSECVDGYCTNPFHYGGCLKSLLPEQFKDTIRVCNSDDPPEAQSMGYCRNSPMDYVEVRIASQDWATSIYTAWILQIILSEILDVPVSVETGQPNVSGDVYSLNSGILPLLENGGTDFFYKELTVSADVKDCRKVHTDDPTKYQSCYHLAPEVWWTARFGSIAIELEGAEPPRELGQLGYQSFWVPRFTVEQDPSLVTYVGLQGEDNRRKLAEAFKRPATWKQYCEDISLDSCAMSDTVAVRHPKDAVEEGSYFVEGLYTGHFRYTEKNDCDANPRTCTGFFADFPCGWGSYAIQQLYHLNIALESDSPDDPVGGFDFAHMQQLWDAANATKSNFMSYWFSPGELYEKFMRTETEFTRVLLPEATQECVDAKIDPSDRCGTDLQLKRGQPEGACADLTQSLKKVIGTALQDITSNPDVSEALWSPAYDLISRFQITSEQIGQLLRYSIERGDAPFNFDPRFATCRWVTENMDLITSFIPESYPRVIQEEDISSNAVFDVAYAIAGVALFLVTMCIVMTFLKKNTKVIYYTQPEFLNLFLFGLLMVTAGAMTLATPPTDATCITTAVLIDLGYALHLTPLAVRIIGINNLASTGKQMQRVRLNPNTLYMQVAVVVLLVGGHLLAWVLIDAPQESFKYEVTDQVTEEGQTIVTAFDYCGSESQTWHFVSFGWKALLLLPASMIAFFAVQVREDMNDTKPMTMVLCIHDGFLLLEVITILLIDDTRRSDLMGYHSLIFSVDTIVCLAVYMLPKFLRSGEELEAEPLPDVFVNTTVALVDVIGFTAWCSVREPHAVFQFLEELFETIEKIAEKHHVFKVETVGECFVAATGVPDPQPNHVVLMAMFASDCMKKMDLLCKKLEVQFGPDTADLALSIAMHSGPATGGFLKGKGARFQLFGDTMTTARLILNAGESGLIHISQSSAQLLEKAGRKKWILMREEKVSTEEKGMLQTYWLTRGRRHVHPELGSVGDPSSMAGYSSDDDDLDEFINTNSIDRWIEWNVEVFKGLLKQIVARRETSSTLARKTSSGFTGGVGPVLEGDNSKMPLEEVQEIIELPDFDRKAAKRQRDNQDVELSQEVVSQLKLYVALIAGMYNDNPFHNFAHASYVVMAVTKYMNRIIAASEISVENDEERIRSTTLAAIHDHTYGITSDPLTQFACVFSAFIHDVDHPGVPNPQLIKEDKGVAAVYKERSVAEQKSLDLSWELLQEDRFSELRSTICYNMEELRRFRQLVVNSVMATDLGDKELKGLRNRRWEKAFNEEEEEEKENNNKEDGRIVINRKATIVIEHLIQAADVAHMSQHWSIYRKWNERLFQETYKAYREGRAATNPADDWYNGELGFLDFYIIPLSKKLRDCGVFGPTSDENLNSSMNNRSMWEKEGQAIVSEMHLRAEAEFDADHPPPKREQPMGTVDNNNGEMTV